MLPPPPVLAPPPGAAELVLVADTVGIGEVDTDGDIDGLGVGTGLDGGGVGRVGVGVGVGVWHVHVGVGVGVGVWQVHLGVGVGEGVGVWQLHVGVGVGVVLPFPPTWPLTAAETPTLAWAADKVVACAAVPVSMNAATPKTKQPDSTRMRIAISHSSSQDRFFAVISCNQAIRNRSVL